MNHFKGYTNSEKIEFTSPLPIQILNSNVSKQGKILEIGCGYGRVLKFLFDSGYKNLTGVDISDHLIKRARINLPNCNYIIANFLEFATTEKFDCIIMCAVMEYIVKQSDREKLVDKIYSILNERGFVFVECFVFDKSYFLKYIINTFKSKKFGIIYSNNATLLHTCKSQIDNLFKKHFTKIDCLSSKFVTWTNCKRNGYSVIYQKI